MNTDICKMAEREKNEFVKQVAEKKYEFGFTTDVQTDIIEKGLNEDIVRLISKKKEEPDSSRDRLSGNILLCRPISEET